MKIVVTGGRKYGMLPSWNATGKLRPHVYTQVPVPYEEKPEWVMTENPEYIRAMERASSERRTFDRVMSNWRRDFSPEGLVIAQGGARGADQLARRWCELEKVECLTFEADWQALGKMAGPIRNRRMLEEFAPDFVIAFPGGAGTESTIQLAKQRRIPVVRVRE